MLYETRTEYETNLEVAIKQLATRIMTNNTGDIVSVGDLGVDYYSAFRTDAFIDLAEHIRNDPLYPRLNHAVLDAVALDGRIKGLPVGVAYTYLIYNKELGDSLGLEFDFDNFSWSDLLDVAILLDEKGIEAKAVGEIWAPLYELIMQNIPDLVNPVRKTQSIRQNWFVDLAEKYKTASKLATFMGAWSSDYRNITGDNCLFRYEIASNTFREALGYFTEGKYELVCLPAPASEISGSITALPRTMYSISNNSPNKEGAWDFLSFLLQEDVQISNTRTWPLNLGAVEQAGARVSSRYDIPEGLMEAFDAVFASPDSLYSHDKYIYDIYYPIKEYVDGQCTLDEALTKAESNVWLRMNE